MRLCGFHIDGFGIFRDQSLQSLPAGLVLFVGNNESGKTTLMEFIRTMFFGFPRRQRNGYPPLRGGAPGGRLLVEMQDGRRVMIARTEKAVTIAEPEAGSLKAEPSAHLLGGMDRGTYERVFALGLTELFGLDVLTEESVRGRLLAAGSGLGMSSGPATMKALDDELANLLKERGTSPIINNLVRQLKEGEGRLKPLQGQAAEYAACQAKREELELRITTARREADQIGQRLRRVEQLRRAREPWVRWSAARKKLVSLDVAKGFPLNGLERLETLKRDIEQLREVRRAREDEALRLEQQLSRLAVEEVGLEHRQEIEALIGEREKLQQAVKDYPLLTEAKDQAEEEFQRRLRELGPDWDAARLAQMDTSVSVRHRVQEFGRQFEAVEHKAQETMALQRMRQEAEWEAKRAVEETQRRLDELPPPPVTDEQRMQDQQDAVRTLRGHLHEKAVATVQLTDKRVALQDAVTRAASIQKQIKQRPDQSSSWTPWVALAAWVILGGVLEAQGAFLPAVIVLLVGGGLAGWLLYLRRRHAGAETSRAGELQAALHDAMGAQRRLDAEIRALSERLETLGKTIEGLAQGAEISTPRDLAEGEALATQLERAKENLQGWKILERQHREAEERWREAHAQFERAAQEADQGQQEQQRLWKVWQAWLAARGVIDAVRPQGFETVVQAVESARVAQARLQEAQLRVTQLEEYIQSTRQGICRVLEALGRPPDSAEVGVEEVDALRLALDAAREARRRHEEVGARLEESRAEGLRLRDQLEGKQKQMTALLQEARVGDEDEFRRMAGRHEEWLVCQKQVEAEDLLVSAIAGTPEEQAALDRELAVTSPIQIQAEEDRLHIRLEELGKDMSEGEREVGGLHEKLLRLAQDEESSHLLLELQTTREQLSDAMKRWAKLVFCRHLLSQAQGIYERERQPQVIREADRFLKTMTNQRYGLLLPIGDRNVQLEDTTLTRTEEPTWSSGLADQVYLAVRLGLAREFGRHSEPLPVVLDDVLLKFDPIRQLGAARVILEFARDQQVLLFSCHPEVRAIVEEVNREPSFQDTVVAAYTVSDGTILPSTGVP